MSHHKKTSLESAIEGGYDVRSGVYSVIDKRITIKLNEYGEYTYHTPNLSHKNSKLKAMLSRTSAMSDESPNEDMVARDLFASKKGIKKSDVIGYHLGLFAGHVVEEDYRQKASSGGLTTWILKELLEKKHIDGVIHVKPSGKNGILFEYGISKSVKSIREGTKTRYYPAELSGSLSAILNLPGKYAVVGLPSIIMELRLLAQNNPQINKKIAYTLGLICGHQKSTKYAESLAWQCGIRPGDLRSIDFRKKAPGLPANDYTTEMTGIVNGKLVTITKGQAELFGSHWGYGFFKTKFSDFTDDTLNETADVSLGDAWLPKYTKDSLGNNILIVRNEIIASILEEGVKNKKIKLDTLSEREVLKSQLGLIHHTRDDLPYRLHKQDRSHKWRPKKRIQAANKASFLRKIVQNLREDMRDKSHIYYAEAVILDDWSYFEKKMKPVVLRYKVVYVFIQLKNRGPSWFIKTLKKRIR